jgi:hypothetical protein
MFGLGDIVAKAGVSKRMLVVDPDLTTGMVWCAWRGATRVFEARYHCSALVLLLRAPPPPDCAKRPPVRY